MLKVSLCPIHYYNVASYYPSVFECFTTLPPLLHVGYSIHRAMLQRAAEKKLSEKKNKKMANHYEIPNWYLNALLIGNV